MRITSLMGMTLVAGLSLVDTAHAAPPAGVGSETSSQTALASAAPLAKVPVTAPAASATPPPPAAVGPALAKPPADKPKVAAPMSREVRAATQRTAEDKLAGHDPAAIAQGLDSLAALGDEQAATAIVARMRRGLPPQLTEHAIESLVKLGKVSAGPALLELTQHRRARTRQEAVTALGALKVRSAQSTLLFALDDPSPEVRSAAALALAGVGTARALPALWTAADRGVDHALEAIGRIASPRELKPIFDHVKSNDVTLIAPALQAMLERESFPLAGKVTLVQEVEKLGSPSARMYLVRWLDAWKQSGQPRLRQALFDAIKRLDDAQKLLSAAAASPTKSAPESSQASKPQPEAATAAAKGARP